MGSQGNGSKSSDEKLVKGPIIDGMVVGLTILPSLIS